MLILESFSTLGKPLHSLVFVIGEMDGEKRVALQNMINQQGGMVYNYVSKRVSM